MPFEKGQSGNPDGRPKGTGDKRTALRALLEPNAEKLVSKAVEMALSGDGPMLKLCIERLVPAYRPEGMTIQLPGLKAAETITDQGKAAISAMADGELSITDAGTLLTAIAQQLRIYEFEDLEKRIAILEKSR